MAAMRLQPTTRKILQIVGPLIALVGISLIVIAIMAMDDITADGGIETFGLGFVGMPVLFVGLLISRFAYLKPMSELIVTETAEAAAFGSHNISKSVAKGIQEGGGLGGNVVKVRCRECGELDDEDAKFCSACGQAM